MIRASRAKGTAFGDVASQPNTTPQSTPSVEAQRKREERNRKQREYRARKKAEANNPYIAPQPTPSAEVQHKREERNTKQRVYRARKKAEANNPYKVMGAHHDMGKSSKGHTAFGVVTSQPNTAPQPTQERNTKQREYRARKKAEANNPYIGLFAAEWKTLMEQGAAGLEKMVAELLDPSKNPRLYITDGAAPLGGVP